MAVGKEDCLEDEVLYVFSTSVIEGGSNHINCFNLKTPVKTELTKREANNE